MAGRRHPFDAAPYCGPVSAGLAPWRLAAPAAGALGAHELALIRGLRPEARAAWTATLGSALFSVVLYAALWGWGIALGLIAGMWVHELGHQRVARRLGLSSSPIVFVPFVGAMQRLRARPASALDAALLALGGPLAGLWFALGCKLAYAATGEATLRLLGTAHALLALIDLLPFGPLDGGRIAAALFRTERVPTRSSAWIIGICVVLVAAGIGLA